jgi:hypothetical protein
MTGTDEPRKPIPICTAVAAFCLLGTIVCLGGSVIGWLVYGDWRWPGVTAGEAFMLNALRTSNLVGVNKIIDMVASLNPGWVYLALTMAFGWWAEVRHEPS